MSHVTTPRIVRLPAYLIAANTFAAFEPTPARDAAGILTSALEADLDQDERDEHPTPVGWDDLESQLVALAYEIDLQRTIPRRTPFYRALAA